MRLSPRLSATAKGFTLVELLVVMAIATALTVAVPSLFSAAFPGLELKGAARRATATLRLARDAAIRTGAETRVILDLEQRRLELEGYRSLQLPKRLELQLDTADQEMLDDQRGAIRFFSDGSSTGGRIVVSHKDHGYQIGVTWLTGRIQLANWVAP